MIESKNDPSVLETIGESSEFAKALFRTKFQQFKLEMVERGTDILASFMTIVLVGAGITSAILFGLTAFAIYLGQILGSLTMGLLIVAGILIILTLLIFAFRGPIIVNPILRILSKNVYETNNYEKDPQPE